MKVYSGDTFAEVYKQLLYDTYYNPDYVISPREFKTNESTNVALVINDPTQCLYENSVRGSQIKYIAGELIWYFNGSDSEIFIKKFSKFWSTIKNEKDNTVNSAYGKIIFNTPNHYQFTQYNWAIDVLKKDMNSRQAVMFFNSPKFQWNNNKDFVCTMNSIFHIRDNALHLTVNMRSNDLILGTPTDIAFFCLLHQQAHKHLKLWYPDLTLGTYTHISNSFHIYERHFELVSNMLEQSFYNAEFPEIKQDLIDYEGNPHYDMTQMYKNILSATDNNELTFTDDLYSWIYNNATAN